MRIPSQGYGCFLNELSLRPVENPHCVVYEASFNIYCSTSSSPYLWIHRTPARCHLLRGHTIVPNDITGDARALGASISWFMGYKLNVASIVVLEQIASAWGNGLFPEFRCNVSIVTRNDKLTEGIISV